jgi:hypothetical protein
MPEERSKDDHYARLFFYKCAGGTTSVEFLHISKEGNALLIAETATVGHLTNGDDKRIRIVPSKYFAKYYKVTSVGTELLL